METLAQDLRYGWRQLRRTPGFTCAAIVALALGIAASTAVFTLVDAIVLRPLPYPAAERLVMVWEVNQGKALTRERISPVNFVDYRSLSGVFEDAAAWWYPQLTLTETGHDPLRVNAIETTPNFFAVLGVQPILGGGFPAAPAYSREGLVVISHRLWRDRFGGDLSILGRSIVLNGPEYRVAGVMPPGFQFPGQTDVWQRIEWDVTQHSRGAHFMEAVARLRQGITPHAADVELGVLARRLAAEHPSTNGEYGARVVPLQTDIIGYLKPALLALFAAAACLLAIACTNVANLLLARATVRQREVAVRAAVGASRGRLARQFLTESLLLAALGTLLGTGGAAVAVRLLVAVSPISLPSVGAVTIDGRVLLFAVTLAILTSLAFGVAPAMLMVREDVRTSLSGGGRDGDIAGRSRARSGLIVLEIATAVVLLVGTALLGRSLQRLLLEDPGFRPSHAVTMTIDLPYSYTDWPKISAFYDRLLTSIRSDPRIAAAGATNFLPLDAGWRGPLSVEGRPHPRPGDELQAQHHTIDEDYFRAIGVSLAAGRFFDAHDTSDAPGVVIINEALARREWPGEDPVGRSVSSPMRVVGPLGRSLVRDTAYRVVGIVRDVRNAGLTHETEPAVYFTFRQFPFRSFAVVVRGTGSPAELLSTIHDAVHRLDPNLASSSGRTLDAIVDDETARPRALVMLSGVFAGLALALAAVGIYGVLSYAVSQRRRELSVRMALGARPGQVVWLVAKEALALASGGILAGALGAITAGRALSTLLYGVAPTDVPAFGVAIALALATVAAASVIPAHRASTLDPLVNLRGE